MKAAHHSILARLALFGTLAGTGLMVATPPAGADPFRPSKADQIKLGKEAEQEVLQKYRGKIVHDARTREINRVADKLLASLPRSSREPWQWKFYLIEDKTVNAFALPGGSVFLFSGLYDRFTSDDETAAVLGHEMAHVYREHWANMVADATKRELGAELLLGLLGAGGNKTWRAVAGTANSLLDLSYSRKDEDQADESGLTNMYRAGFDPQGMLDLFATLKSAGGDGGTPEFLRDHPLTQSRINKTKERILKLKRDKASSGSPTTPMFTV